MRAAAATAILRSAIGAASPRTSPKAFSPLRRRSATTAGKEIPRRRDALTLFFDKKARTRLAKANPGAARDADRLRRTYAIVGSDGIVITVGHRYRRVTRG